MFKTFILQQYKSYRYQHESELASNIGYMSDDTNTE